MILTWILSFQPIHHHTDLEWSWCRCSMMRAADLRCMFHIQSLQQNSTMPKSRRVHLLSRGLVNGLKSTSLASHSIGTWTTNCWSRSWVSRIWTRYMSGNNTFECVWSVFNLSCAWEGAPPWRLSVMGSTLKTLCHGCPHFHQHQLMTCFVIMWSPLSIWSPGIFYSQKNISCKISRLLEEEEACWQLKHYCLNTGQRVVRSRVWWSSTTRCLLRLQYRIDC